MGDGFEGNIPVMEESLGLNMTKYEVCQRRTHHRLGSMLVYSGKV